jgi:hypothetical protein
MKPPKRFSCLITVIQPCHFVHFKAQMLGLFLLLLPCSAVTVTCRLVSTLQSFPSVPSCRRIRFGAESFKYHSLEQISRYDGMFGCQFTMTKYADVYHIYSVNGLWACHDFRQYSKLSNSVATGSLRFTQRLQERPQNMMRTYLYL